MREIKFRGKHINNEEWVYGSYSAIPQPNIMFINEKGEVDCAAVDPETVGQYTGLKDKNGKEIYEGDIIRFTIFDYNGADTQYKGVVKWANAMFEIWHDTKSEYYGSDGSFVLSWIKAQDDELEVIGNIYENPDLLEAQT